MKRTPGSKSNMNFGSLPEGLHAKADAGMMDKVISNQLENAAKYSNPRSPITISTEANDHKAFLSMLTAGQLLSPGSPATDLYSQ